MRKNLKKIQIDLGSPDAGVRGRAMQELFLWARKDRSIHAAALPIFRDFAEKAVDAWSSVTAVCGIEAVAGNDAARPAWLTLLNHPKVEFARHAALAVTNPQYTPELMKILEKATDIQHKRSLLRVLGRMRDKAAFSSLTKALEDPEVRADAIEALGDLYDYRAIPLLEPFLNDRTQTGYVDNHGPPMRMCDHASAAIATIKLHAGVKPVIPIPPTET